MADQSVEELVKNRYPNLYNVMRSNDELWKILVWGVGTGMSEAQVDAAYQASNYYRTHTQEQRAWDVQIAVDPTTAARAHQQQMDIVWAANQRLGTGMGWNQAVEVARSAAINGWTPAQVDDYLVAYTKWEAYGGVPGTKPGGGEFTQAMTKVRAIANDYGLPVDSQTAVDEAAKLLSATASGGQTTEDALRGKFADQAKSLYPSLAPQLEAGTTVAQWAQPYKALAASELEQSPDSITFNDPKWRAMLEGTKDPKTGQVSPMTLSEWQAKIRQGSVYGYDKTTGAKQQASQIETELLKRFGGVG